MARTLIKEIKDSKKNYLINGNFNLWQRGAANVTGLGSVQTYHADRFQWAAGTITGQVTSSKTSVTTYANNTSLPRTCSFMQQYTVTTAQPALSAGSTAGPWLKIEGYDVNEILEQGGLTNGITLSFYVASSVTGTYTVQFASGGLDNFYFKTYTINTANTWQRVSMYLTGAELLTGISSGTWNYANGIGMYIRFWIASGTGAQGANQNLWTGATSNVSTSQANVLSTLNNTWGITGLMLTLGNVVPDFKIRGNSIDHEISMCQRYYAKTQNLDLAPNALNGGLGTVSTGTAAGQDRMTWVFSTRMRVAPTITLYNPTTGATGTWRDGGGVDRAVNASSMTETLTVISNSGAITDATTLTGHASADAEL
jgi:hypothetical protein